MKKTFACALLLMASPMLGGCLAAGAIAGSLVANNEVAKSRMPPPESLTAAELGIDPARVTIVEGVENQGNIVEGITAHWTASVDGGDTYRCEYLDESKDTNCFLANPAPA